MCVDDLSIRAVTNNRVVRGTLKCDLIADLYA